MLFRLIKQNQLIKFDQMKPGSTEQSMRNLVCRRSMSGKICLRLV